MSVNRQAEIFISGLTLFQMLTAAQLNEYSCKRRCRWGSPIVWTEVGVNVFVGVWRVTYDLNMVVKYRRLQLGDSARISHCEMTWYSFDLDTMYFCLDAAYVSSYHSALFFWSLLYILMTFVFPVWSSVIIFSLCSSLFNAITYFKFSTLATFSAHTAQIS